VCDEGMIDEQENDKDVERNTAGCSNNFYKGMQVLHSKYFNMKICFKRVNPIFFKMAKIKISLFKK